MGDRVVVEAIFLVPQSFLPKPIAPSELLQVLVHGRPAALREEAREEAGVGRSASM